MAESGGADPAFGLKISPGVVLRNLLQQYPSGGQFFLEALQNADDTGRSGKFCALLDLRRHPCKSLREPVAARALLQSEAILFYDDAGFKDRDWRSIQFMCDSVKRQSPHEQGAFGMGSRSYFHITDVLQVLSGTRLSALDPDDLLQTGHFGEQIDFVKDDLLSKFPDECAAFKGVFGCDLKSSFKGSIIRASLRREERAKTCTFMPQAFDLSRATRIFQEFEETLKDGEVILFLTNVASVELWRWDDGASEPSRITSATLGMSSGHKLPRAPSGPGVIKRYLEKYESFADLEAELRKDNAELPEILDIVDMKTEVFRTNAVTHHRWLRLGSFTQDQDIVKLVEACKCVPLAALALPIGHKTEGNLYASLPLPLTTRLPVHVNGFFRLHDNRRGIWRHRSDLDGEHKLWGQWNDLILTNFVPKLYSKALRCLAELQDVTADHGYSCWPTDGAIEKEFNGMIDPLVTNLKDIDVLPSAPTGKLVKPGTATYFPTPSSALQACRARLLELCAEANWVVVDPPEHIVDLLHKRKALSRKTCTEVFLEVVLPAASKLEEQELARLILAFLEWDGSWKEAEIRDFAKKFALVKWVPCEDNVVRTVGESFDPANCPEALRVVKERRARLGDVMEANKLKAETVWHVLGLCGLKKEITWEDAVDEANAVVQDASVERARLLFERLNQQHSKLQGDRKPCLGKLKELPWVPAVEATPSPEQTEPTKLLALKDVFPMAARKLVWAVAPSLCLESSVDELRPGRKVDDEPDVLVEQVRALAEGAVTNGGGTPPYASAATLEHLRAVFGPLLGLISKLKNFKEHPRLKGIAFVPCLTLDETNTGALLFHPDCAAFQSHRSGAELNPVIGLVKQVDQTIKMIAEAAGVSKEPRLEVLSQALARSGAAAPKLELAVALASELAARLKAQNTKLDHVVVPTVKGTIESVKHVFINDAVWWHQRGVVTLHNDLSAEEGSILGCTSLRQEMARLCEGSEAAAAPSKEDAAKEVELTGKLRILLQEFGDGANIVSEFIQNCDNAGGGSVAFFLSEEAFSADKILDPRSAALQGAALYVCSDRELSSEDVQRMQAMGHLWDETRPGCLSGDFGVGFSFMYRYCDCPLLLASKRIHFFDLTRGFVASPGMAWVRHFAQEKLKDDFPDSHAPFEAKCLAGKFPTIFRLPLRTKRSDLGLNLELSVVRDELKKVAASADKILLFTRAVRKLEFHDGDALLAEHEKCIEDRSSFTSFISSLPQSAETLKAGEFSQHLAHSSIKTRSPEATATADWIVAHQVGVRNEEAMTVVKDRASKRGGLAAALPHSAAALRVSPVEGDLQGGKVCCGSALPHGCNSSAWIGAGFALPPSRKTLPLPEAKDSKPSPDQAWNKLLLEGPVAESIRGLIVHCTSNFLSRSMIRQNYFALFPKPGDRFQSILATASVNLDWIFSVLINPDVSKLDSQQLAGLTLALLEWSGSWKDAEVKELSKKISDVKWLPSEDGSLRTIADSFDPAIAAKEFRIVKDKLAKIDDIIVEMELNTETVWRVLRLCGMKQDITWQDAVDEAEVIIVQNDLEAAKGLFEHVNKCHSSMKGARAEALTKLQSLAWAPALQATSGQEPSDDLKLMLLKDVYPCSARKLTWAVAPTLCLESAVSELKPGLSVDKNPEVLVEQVKALASAAESKSGLPPVAPAPLVEHLRVVFGALLPLLPKLQTTLSQHPKLSDVAFVPCHPVDDDDAHAAAALFVPENAAFRAQHAHLALYPVIGIVRPADSNVKRIAEAAGVTKEPRATVLAQALSSAPKGDLGVALAIELASRIRSKEEKPENIMVPTSEGTIQPVSEVFIDDAPWKHRSNRITTVNKRISAEDATILGCTSLRDEMARQAEDEEGGKEADKAAQEEDGFGQEADLISQVKQLLQEYGDSADLVQEFVQNNDDAGANEVAFFLDETQFGKETIVDARAGDLQGPALYIGSDKPLTSYDIGRMQCVGNSAKRMDWTSSGRFGVGLNVMYRYCDCPQLLANDRLHFFDLTRSFVAQGGGKRGRQFTIQKLQENFPDNFTPFEIDMAKRFPTVFRMALRPKRSELGLKMPLTNIRDELQWAADMADKMLLFTKNLRKLEFWAGKRRIACHEATVNDKEGYAAFLNSVPKSPMDLKPGQFKSYLGSKVISTERSVQVKEGDDDEKAGPGKIKAEWAISHRVGVTDDKMFRVLKEQFEQPHGVALLPSAAAAVMVSPVELGKREGRICCGLPTPFRSNSSAWINGAFALLSSRKTLPLPEEKDQRPSLDKAWNRMLLQGPAAEAMRGLICHSTSLVLYKGFTMDQYFEMFPLRGDRLQTILAIATLKATMSEAMFPVSRTDKISWVAGPRPLFKTKDLPGDVQEGLITDGLKLVYLPDKLLAEYEEALGKPKSELNALELCKFLREKWAFLHPDKDPERMKTGDAFDDFTKEDLTIVDGSKELDFDNTGISALATKEYIINMLSFAVKGLWAAQCKEEKEKKDPSQNFEVRELAGVPLLLTHEQCITVFGLRTKFNSWRDILPAKKNIFMDREVHTAAMDSIDIGLAGASNLVMDTTLPGVRPFTLKDLLPFRDAVEASFDVASGFMDAQNESLRQFWSLVADTFAQSMQERQNLSQVAYMKAKAQEAGEDVRKVSLVQLKNDTSWTKDITDWRVLPICSSQGMGDNGENLVPLSNGRKCVALTLVTQDEQIIDSLTGILQECGIDTVQHDIMSDDRISRLIRTIVVTTNEEMLDLLVSYGNVENLSALQRHELLAYFSMLCVKGGVQLAAVKRLPLFKTIDVDTQFVALEDGVKYACIDPNDPHAASLSKLTPDGLKILAWPTQQVKPMYEYCDVKLCNGEDFICSEVLPQLPSIVAEDPDGSKSKPFLMELHAYCCRDDRASNVRQMAADISFVPSEDLSRVAEPRSFVSPAGAAAGLFREVLSSHVPVGWMSSNLYMMELLQQLGMEMVLNPSLILLCAQDLDDSYEHLERGSDQNSGAATEELRLKSFELVEEWARASEEVWPRPRPGQLLGGPAGGAPPPDVNVDDMKALLKAASLRIFMSRRHNTITTREKDAKERNAKKEMSQIKHAEVELVPLAGIAFKTARQVLWTGCPLDDHRSREGAEDSYYLKELLEKHPKGMYNVFGAYSSVEQAPVEEVFSHLAGLCRLTKAQDKPDIATVKSETLLHEDLRACWKQLAESCSAVEEANFPSERQEALDKLKVLPCVAVTLEDVGSAAVDLTTLTLPRYSFFQLPLFKGKEANMRQYLRQVHAETSKEAAVFRMLGASDKPRAQDYARTSERIAGKAEELGRTDFEWINTCLEACVRGAFEDLSDAATQAAGEGLDLSNLRVFTQDLKIKKAGALIWADEPRWLKRCEKADMSFWAGISGTDSREIADCLVKHAGMAQLTLLVEERRVADDEDGEADNLEAVAFKDNVEQMVQSNELACGLHAVIRQTTESAAAKSDLAEVSAALRSIKFVATKTRLRSALYRKSATSAAENPHKEEDDEVLDVQGGVEKKRRVMDPNMITGSELDQEVYFDEKERSVYIGDARFGAASDTFTAELVFALRRALPLLFSVDQFLLEAMARCALQEGPAGIPPFLEKRDIPVDTLLAPRHLGPGDRLPQELQDHLQWAMDTTFGEGETVAVLVGDAFTIAEVAKWPGEQQNEEGLMRSYYIKVSASKFEKRKHFEVYKIQNSKSAASEKKETSTDIVISKAEGVEASEAKDGLVEEAPKAEEASEDDDKKQLRDIIEYLKEMGKMEPADYKAVMRRLFKTWHPDKVGDTPIANRIFHLLRTHEAWYKRKAAGEAVGDDSWLESSGLDPDKKPDGDLLAIESGDAPEEGPKGGQGSWFHEFEKEMMQAKEDREAGRASQAQDDERAPRVVKPPGATIGPDGRVMVMQEEIYQGPPRVVDKQLAPRFLKEAQMEVHAARRLAKDYQDGYSSLHPRAVFHCQQAVEMALRSAMLRTCGVAEDEVAGGAAHDLIDFIKRIKTAEVNTEEQRKAAQELPLNEQDVEWLKHAYLASRYPKPGRYGVPALLYGDAEANRALKLAEDFLKWAADVEDLPDPSKFRRKRWAGDSDDRLGRYSEGDQPSVMLLPPGGPPAAFAPDGGRTAGQGITMPPPGRGVTVPPPKRSSSDLDSGAAESELKRQKSEVGLGHGVEPGTKVTKRWARKS